MASHSQGTIRSFRDLEVWQAAMDLTVDVYDMADRLPQNERFILAAHLKRSAVSIPSNVAEGHAHRGDRTFLRHVRIALGSLAELDTQVEVALRRAFVTPEQVKNLSETIARTGQMLHGLERSLKRRALNRVVACAAYICSAGVVAWRVLVAT